MIAFGWLSSLQQLQAHMLVAGRKGNIWLEAQGRELETFLL